MAEKKADKKPDVVLSDGREVTFDLNKLSVREWRELTNLESPMEIERQDEILIRVSGLDCDLVSLGFADYRKLSDGFWKAATRPLDNPN